MSRIISRQEVYDMKIEDFSEILDRESHHNHEIVIDSIGTVRWAKNTTVSKYIEERSLSDVIESLYNLGYNKNSEVYRKLYRDIGYSLNGYWEVFYWDANNKLTDEYDGTN